MFLYRARCLPPDSPAAALVPYFHSLALKGHFHRCPSNLPLVGGHGREREHPHLDLVIKGLVTLLPLPLPPVSGAVATPKLDQVVVGARAELVAERVPRHRPDGRLVRRLATRAHRLPERRARPQGGPVEKRAVLSARRRSSSWAQLEIVGDRRGARRGDRRRARASSEGDHGRSEASSEARSEASSEGRSHLGARRE